MTAFDLHVGSSPLVISVPHDGREVPDAIRDRFTDAARALPDTDWHVARLYDFAKLLGATMLVARYSRYVVDLNRPPDDQALYETWGTGLVPRRTFDGQPIYSGPAPDGDEVRGRLETFWRPYHDELRTQLDRAVGDHGHALLWDAHSIRRVVPNLFEGRLPDLNLGTADGAACADPIARAVASRAAASSYTWVRDGRFRGGHITRAYGQPGRRIHAIQLELVQSTYMDERTGAYDETQAEAVQAVIREMLEAYVDAAATQSG